MYREKENKNPLAWCAKIECIHICVTGSPCCTVEKNCIGEVTIKKIIITKKGKNKKQTKIHLRK